MNIKIEFPVLLLSSYNGAENLDVTWDNDIAPLIHQSLREAGISLQNAKVDFVKAIPQVNDEKISYSFNLTTSWTELITEQLVDALKEAGYQAGLCIKEVVNNRESVLYAESDCADIQVRRQRQQKNIKRR